MLRVCSKNAARLSVLLIVTLIAVSAAHAAEYTWTGSISTDWFDARNWSVGGVVGAGIPGAADTANVLTHATVSANSDVTVTNLYLGAGSTLTGAGNVTATGTFTVVDATIGGTGGVNIPTSGQLNFENAATITKSLEPKAAGEAKANRKIVNSGAIHVRNSRVYFGADFRNQRDALVEIESDATLSRSVTGISFVNSGTIRRSRSSGVATVDVPLTNDGTIEITTGALNFRQGTNGGGVFTTAAGAHLSFSAGTHSFNGSSRMDGAGSVYFNGATVGVGGTYAVTGITSVVAGTANFTGFVTDIGAVLNVSGGLANFSTGPFSAATINMSAGTLTGSTDITTNGAINWTGGLMSGTGKTIIAPGAALNIKGGADKNLQKRTIYNRGRATWSDGGKLRLGDGTVFNNDSGGSFFIQNDASCAWSGTTTPPAFNNAGVLFKNTTTGTSTFSGVPFNNSGIVDLRTGTLACNGGFTQNVGNTELNGGNLSATKPILIKGGRLAGTGKVSGSVTNSALLGPGHSPGMISILGNYTQTSTGTLNIEIGGLNPGTQFDQVNINGTATLDGTLNITLIDGYVPLTNDAFRIMTFINRSGDFKIKNGLNQGGGLYFAPRYNSTDLTLSSGLTSDSAAPVLTFTQPVTGGFTNSLATLLGNVTDGSGIGVAGVILSLQRGSDNTYWDAAGVNWVALGPSASPPMISSVLTGTSGMVGWSVSSALPSDLVLQEGLYTLRGIAYDRVFNSSSLSINATVDKQAPATLTFVSPAANSAVASLSSITAAATDNVGGSGIARVNFLLNRGSDNAYWHSALGTWVAASPSLPEMAASLSSGKWVRNTGLPSGAALPAGIYNLTAYAYDKAGNYKSTIISVTIDRTVPAAVAITSPLNEAFVKSLPQVTGTAADNTGGSGIAQVTVQLYRYANSLYGTAAGFWAGGTTWTTSYISSSNERPASGTTSWALSLPSLTPGRYYLRAMARDRAGNWRNSNYASFTVDPVTPASLNITVPASASIVNKLTALTATAADNAGGSGIARVEMSLLRRSDNLYWTGSSTTGWGALTTLTTVFFNGTWTSTTGLPAGSHLTSGPYQLNATAFDKAGNRKTASIYFTVDVTLPAVNITQPGVNYCYNNVASALGTASDSGSGVRSVTVQLYRVGNSTLGVTPGYWGGGSTWTTTYSATNERPATGTLTWDLTLPTAAQGFAASQYRLRATVRDMAGNVQSTSDRYFTLDPAPPVSVSIPTPVAGSVIRSLPAVRVAASDNNGGTGIANVSLSLQRRSDSRYWTGASATGWSASPALLATALSAGFWVRTSGLPGGVDLLDGLYDLSATAYDRAGNHLTTTITFRVDNTRPTIGVVQPLANGMYSALSAVNGIAADDAGSGVVTVHVKLYRLANSGIGSTAGYWAGGSTWTTSYIPANDLLAGGTNNWSLLLPTAEQGLTDGVYRLIATARDRAGNAANSAYVYFTIDTSAPATVAFAAPLDGSQIRGFASITGSATDNAGGSGIARTELFIRRLSDGTYWSGNTTAGWGTRTALPTTGISSWTCSASLPSGSHLQEGSYELTATAYDKVGNATTRTIGVTVDLTSPTVSVLQPQPYASYASLSTIDGLANDAGSGVTRLTVVLCRTASVGVSAGFWAGGSNWTNSYSTANDIPVVGTTAWSLTLPTPEQGLVPGKYWILVTVRDRAGNSQTSGYIYFYIDSIAPQIAFTTPPDGVVVNRLSAVKGTATDNLGVSHIQRVSVLIHRLADDTYWTGNTVTGWGSSTPLAATGTGSWALSSTLLPAVSDLAEGSYELTATVEDKAGNVAGVTSHIVVDKTPPDLVVVEPTANTSYASLLSVNGAANDSGGAGVAVVRVQLYRIGNSASGTTSGFWNGASWDSTYSAAAELLATGTEIWSLWMPTATAGFLPGRYRIRVTATDGAGNMASSGYIYFDIVSELPLAESSTTSTINNVEPVASTVTLSSARVSAATSMVELVFTGALNAIVAAETSHYAVGATTSGQAQRGVAVMSATYNDSTNTVVLQLAAQALAAGDTVIVGWHELQDTQGRTLSGTSAALTAQ